MRKACELLLICGLFSGSTRIWSQQQPPVCEIAPVYGCESSLHQNLRHAIEGYGQAAAAQAALEGQIESSRAAVARACSSSKALRDHPERITELPQFLSRLNGKDVVYVMYRSDALHMGPQSQAMMEMVNRLVGGGHGLDHGLRRQAEPAFQEFASGIDFSNMTEISREMQSGSGDILSKSAHYQRYILARNLSELNGAGCNLTSDEAGLWLAVLAIEEPWGDKMSYADSLEGSAKYYQALSEAYGKEAMGRAARAVMEAKKNKQGDVIVQGQPSSSYKALQFFLSGSSVPSAVTSLLLDWSSNFSLGRVAQVEVESRALAAAYGEPVLASVVTTLGTAKRTDLGNLMNASEMGIQRGSSRGSLFDLLAARSPGSYARAVVAIHDKLGTKQELDQAISRLSARSSVGAVTASGEAIVAMWKTPRGVLVQREKQMTGFANHYADGSPGLDYDLLTGLVNKTATIPPLDVEVANSPVYAVWSKKPVGTTATYAETQWDVRNGRIFQAPRSSDFVQVFKLKDVNASRVLLETVEGNVSQRMPDPTEVEISAKDYALKDKTGLPPQRSTVVSETKGTQTLVVNGQAFPCTWDKSIIHLLLGEGPRYITTVEEEWDSDASPGGRVMHRTMINRDNGTVWVKELLLQPTNVTDYSKLRPGFPTVFRVTEGTGGPDGGTGELTAAAESGANTGAGVGASGASGTTMVAGTGAGQTLLRGTRLRVSIAQDMDAGALASGKTVRGTLADNVSTRGTLVFGRGADVRMEVAEEQGQPFLILRSIGADGNSQGMQTSRSRVALRMRPAGEFPRIPFGGGPFGRPAVRREQGRYLAAGTIQEFVVTQDSVR